MHFIKQILFALPLAATLVAAAPFVQLQARDVDGVLAPVAARAEAPSYMMDAEPLNRRGTPLVDDGYGNKYVCDDTSCRPAGFREQMKDAGSTAKGAVKTLWHKVTGQPTATY